MPLLPRQPEVNIGTAGHVDHGKTTLVESITGVWTSAHSEELRRGITIKVGYADTAFYKCPHCLPPTSYSTSPKCPRCGSETELLRVVSFVDSPGHESLMVNMLSGAAVMDGAVLVIAADEKVPRPQTREHLLALQMLGGTSIVVAQNKVDLLSEDEAVSNYSSVLNFTKGTVAEDAPVIPISAQQKLNIDALIEAIEKRILTPKRSMDLPAKMLVLRSFDINRPGAAVNELKGGVLGGTLVQGTLKVGDEIELRPGKPDPKTSKYNSVFTKVSSLGTGAGIVESVKTGGLIAVGTGLDPFLTKSDALVGTVVGLPAGLPPVLEEVSMDTKLFDTAVGTLDMVRVEKVRPGESLRLNVMTAPTLSVVSSVRDGMVEAKLRRPVCASQGDKVAISRRIEDRWRLIGLGILK